MITKTLRTLNGKIKVKIPTGLDEISIGQMIEMNKLDLATAENIPLMPGLTREVLDNVIDYNELVDLQQHVLSLAHQIKYCYNETAIPEFVYFGQTKVKVIRNLSIEPAGAFLASRDLIADEINKHIAEYGEDGWKENFNPSLDTVAMVLAHYFYCRVTGSLYVEQKAEEFKDEILKLPLQTALPIARHFFLSYPDLLQQKLSLLQLWRMKWKSALALRRLKSSRTSTRSIL